MKKRIRQIIAIALIIVTVVTSVRLEVYAGDGAIEYDGKIWDWLFDYAKRNNVVALSKQAKDEAQKAVNTMANGNAAFPLGTAVDILSDVSNDYISRMKWNVTTGIQAIKNTFFEQPQNVQNNIANVYNAYKNQNIVLSPEIIKNINISQFNQAIYNNNVLTVESPKTTPVAQQYNIYDDYVYTLAELREELKTGRLYPYIEYFSEWAQALKDYADSIVTGIQTKNAKYYYFVSIRGEANYVTYKNTYMMERNGLKYFRTDNTSTSEATNIPSINAGTRYNEKAGKLSGYYPGLIIRNYATKEGVNAPFNIASLNGWGIGYSKSGDMDGDVNFYSFTTATQNQSLASIKPWDTYVVRITIINPTIQNMQTVINEYTEQMQNVVNNYDYSTIENSYNNEYAPAVTNSYTYNYITDRAGDNYYNTTNNDYSQVINYYITNNTYNDSHDVTYVTDTTIITPSPTPDPGINPTPTPAPGQNNDGDYSGFFNAFSNWLTEKKDGIAQWFKEVFTDIFGVPAPDKPPDATPPPDDSGGDDTDEPNVFDEIGGKLKDLLISIAELLAKLIKGLMDALIGIINKILEGIETFFKTILKALKEIPLMFGQLPELLKALFEIIPQELVLLIIFSITLLIVAAVIKRFIG